MRTLPFTLILLLVAAAVFGFGRWLGNSYGYGHNSYAYDRGGGVGGYRSGGPGAGGK